MSDVNNTPETEVTETQELTQGEDVAVSYPEEPSLEKKPSHYTNKTAKALNIVFWVLLALTVIFTAFQLYYVNMSAMQQGWGIALLMTAPSLLLYLIAMLAISFLFKFFAEVVELMDKNKA